MSASQVSFDAELVAECDALRAGLAVVDGRPVKPQERTHQPAHFWAGVERIGWRYVSRCRCGCYSEWQDSTAMASAQCPAEALAEEIELRTAAINNRNADVFRALLVEGR